MRTLESSITFQTEVGNGRFRCRSGSNFGENCVCSLIAFFSKASRSKFG